ncbi:hypothetical protein HanRHA438_Chr04g0164201 [Helianthus annuus]|nr:hypothetical protein HanOQP8_Chr04g0139251 [Helianthus annuus]KAJ0925838.1 hypothetical protein HanRHA438_Chr04g0164201 [Helianthus annuus]
MEAHGMERMQQKFCLQLGNRSRNVSFGDRVEQTPTLQKRPYIFYPNEVTDRPLDKLLYLLHMEYYGTRDLSY